MTADTTTGSTTDSLPDDLGRHQLLVYLLVSELEPVTPSTIVDRSEYSRSTVAEDLRDLQRRGYITTETNYQDRRKTLYRLNTSA